MVLLRTRGGKWKGVGCHSRNHSTTSNHSSKGPDCEVTVPQSTMRKAQQTASQAQNVTVQKNNMGKGQRFHQTMVPMCSMDRYEKQGASPSVFMEEARISDLVCPDFFRKLWLQAIFARGYGIYIPQLHSTNKMVHLDVLGYTKAIGLWYLYQV